MAVKMPHLLFFALLVWSNLSPSASAPRWNGTAKSTPIEIVHVLPKDCTKPQGAKECKYPGPLGMEDGRILDSQLSQSSSWSYKFTAARGGRLNSKATRTTGGAWIVRRGQLNRRQWLQVDFGKPEIVTAVATQGRQKRNQWVTLYKVFYSNDGNTFELYPEDGVVFLGNKDRNTVVRHNFSTYLTARYIRINPIAWHNYIAMRVELYGCHPGVKPKPCESSPCENGGTCTNAGDSFLCICPDEFQGKTCKEPKPKPCDSSPCKNGGTCTNIGNSFLCICPDDFQGKTCKAPKPTPQPCDSSPCENGGTCTNIGNSFLCICPDEFQGRTCKEPKPKPKPCDSSPCQNGGNCTNKDTSFSCECPDNFQGKTCGETKCPHAKLDLLLVVDGSGSVRQKNFAKVKKFIKKLNQKFDVGPTKTRIALMQFGKPGDTRIEFNLEGKKTLKSLNDGVDEMVYLNARGTATGDALRRAREKVFNGKHGDRPAVDNVLILFTDGEATDAGGKDVQVEEAQKLKDEGVKIITVGMGRKQTIAKFRDKLQAMASKDHATGKILQFQADFEALDSITNALVETACGGLKPCDSSPCKNGGSCTNKGASFSCICPKGFQGKTCEEPKPKPCASSPCENGGTCTNAGDTFVCICPVEFQGKTCKEPKPKPCDSSPCKNGGTCTNLGNSFLCLCPAEFQGKTCKEPTPKPCDSSPCENGGTCTNIGDTFFCLCPDDFQGKTCKEPKPKPCDSSPCKNGGTCTNMANSFLCICPDEFQGKTCEEPKPCESSPCQNGGNCTNKGTSFSCQCPDNFQGKTCGEIKCPHAKLDLLLVVDGSGSVRRENFAKVKKFIKKLNLKFDVGPTKTRIALMQFGVPSDTRIEFNLKDKKTLKNVNDGVDKVIYLSAPGTATGDALRRARKKVFNGKYGDRPAVDNVLILFTDGEATDAGGKNVQVQEAQKLKDQGVKIITVGMGRKQTIAKFLDKLQAMASKDNATGKILQFQADFKALDSITNALVETACGELKPCDSSPCKNGGRCANKGASFLCICPEGFQGKTCKEPKPKPCDSSPCENGGTCTNAGNSFVCICPDEFQGKTCKEPKPKPCDSSPCEHGGSCTNMGDSFLCLCPDEFQGKTCKEPKPKPCDSSPCKNGGTCTNIGNSFLCICPDEFQGNTCKEPKPKPCDSSPCQNGGTCTNIGNLFLCICPDEFQGRTCKEPKRKPCDSSPCQNGGNCTNKGNSFSCQCPNNFQGKTCAEIKCPHAKRDLLLVVDGSGSVRKENFAKVKKFIKKLNQKFDVGPTKTRIALMQFGKPGDTRIEFNLKDKKTLKNLNDGVDEMVYLNARGTATGDALRRAREKIFNGRDGDRPAVGNVLILFTDGEATDTGGKDVQVEEAQKLKDEGVKIITVGMGQKQTIARFRDKLQAMASKDHATGKTLQFQADFKALDTITNALVETACGELKPCDSSPCQNGGNCTNRGASFSCECPEGFQGKTCAVPKPKPCDSSPCENGGTCTNAGNSFVCICPDEFQGKTCKEPKPKPCDSSPCENGGTCTNIGDSFLCLCPDEFQGKTCREPKPKPCDSSPCKNGGTCTNVGDLFLCLCPDEFQGKTCEEPKRKPCDSSPCQNGGNCTNKGTSFSCQCPDNFQGRTCGEPKPKPCDSSPCENGGTCTNVGSSFLCLCPDEFQGKTCKEPKPKPCDSSPCENGGTCTNIGDSFLCLCPDEFQGKTCKEPKPKPCDSSPCDNGGTCTNIGYSFLCICPDEFQGKTCEEPKPKPKPCDSAPCQNGGNCTNKGTLFSCECPDNFHGKTCGEVKCHHTKLDILLVVDGSGSVKQKNFNTVKKFIKKLNQKFDVGPTETRIALMQFGVPSNTRIEFNLKETKTLKNVNDGVDKMIYLSAPGTATGDALRKARQKANARIEFNLEDKKTLKNVNEGVDKIIYLNARGTATGDALRRAREKVFNGKYGDRPAVHNVLILFTDGEATDAGGKDVQVEEAQKLKDEGVKIITVGIGQKQTIAKFRDKLQAMASKDHATGKILQFQADFKALDSITNVLVETVCGELKPCDSSPCKNGGNCTNNGASFLCICPKGFQGKTCKEPKPKPCDSSPCENGGTCTNAGDSFLCICPDEFQGKTCKEPKPKPCDSSPCKNGGTCTNIGDLFMCLCPDEFQGKTCTEPKPKPCDSSPCENGGTCTNTGASFLCLCPEGFEGKTCGARKPKPCDSSPCENGGKCIDTCDSFFCQCPDGFWGKTCGERKPKPCASSPCQNGGKCIDKCHSFVCECPDNFQGETCEEIKVCNSTRLDILLVVDGSGSVRQHNFDEIKKFIKKLTTKFDVGPTKTRIALMQFGKPGDTRIEFNLEDKKTIKTVNEGVDKMVYLKARGTATGDALRKAREKVFDGKNGDRPGIDNVLMLFTDGEASDAQGKDFQVEQAQKLKDQGVKVITVGMGHEKTIARFRNKLKAMASRDDRTGKILQFQADFKDLDSIANALAITTCQPGGIPAI